MKEDFMKSDSKEVEIEIEISSELLKRVTSMAESLNINLHDLYCTALDEYIAKHDDKKDSNAIQGEL